MLKRRMLLAAVVVGIFLHTSAFAIKLTSFEGSLHGFPALRQPNGKKLAEGNFAQCVEAERLHVKLTYQFPGSRRIEETAEFRQRPELIQDKWSWRELRDGEPVRRFELDFGSGQANAEKREDQELKRWSEKVDIEPGRTFAGFGFVLAIKNLRERLIGREKLELMTVGFTPKPRSVSVEISHTGREQMRMADRTLKGLRPPLTGGASRCAHFFRCSALILYNSCKSF